MLAARNERRARRGEEPLDLDAEVARLTAPAVDPVPTFSGPGRPSEGEVAHVA